MPSSTAKRTAYRDEFSLFVGAGLTDHLLDVADVEHLRTGYLQAEAEGRMRLVAILPTLLLDNEEHECLSSSASPEASDALWRLWQSSDRSRPREPLPENYRPGGRRSIRA
jgi:hypothetical protein